MALSAAQVQRNKVGNAARYHPGSPAEIEARRNLAELKLEAYIKRAVDAAPLLTAEQRDRLALLLRPAS